MGCTQGRLASAGVTDRWKSRAGRLSLAVAGIVCLDLRLDPTAIRSCADAWQDRADTLNKTMLHHGSRVLKRGLDDVVGEVVAEKVRHLAGRKQLVHDHILGHVRSAAEAFLDHIGAELVTRETGNAAVKLTHNRLSEVILVEINNVLNNVVAEWILDQGDRVSGDHVNEPRFLDTVGMIDAALKNTATVTVGTNVDTVLANRLEDESSVIGVQFVETLLNDVVAVEILDELNNLVAKSIFDELDLNWRGDMLDHLLEGSSTMLIQSNANHSLGCVLDQDGSLVIVAVLEQLLAKIVAEGIGHQFDDMLVGLEPDDMNLVGLAVLQLLLQVAAAVLVLAQAVDTSNDALQWEIVVASHGWLSTR